LVVTISKELFIESIYEIEKQLIHDRNCNKAFQTILPNDYVSGYDNNLILNQLVKLLKVSVGEDYGWIDYFIYELDCGKLYDQSKVLIAGKPFELKTPEDLWAVIVELS
jgi:hypothetical protein